MMRCILVSCLVVVSTSALALSPEEREFLQKQDQLQRELIDLRMQVQVLEQKAKIADLERKIKGQPDMANLQPISQPPLFSGAPGAAGGPFVPPPSFAAPRPDKPGSMPAKLSLDEAVENDDIKLVSVFGDPANLQAEVLERGVRIRVSPGYQLQSGWTVSKIETSRLTLKRGNNVKTVGY
jgi:hypothetical protein